MKDVLRKQTVLFQGDSITDCGRDADTDANMGGGYPASVAAAYGALFPESGATFVNRGVSGNRSIDLLARYQADFADVRPDWVSILIGINDVWRAYDSGDPTSAETFSMQYEELLKRIKADMPGAKIIVIEPFLLPTLQERMAWHIDLDPKQHVARKLAAKYADYFLPMDGLFASYIAEGASPAELAADGVHPTSKGHGVIAYEWLRKIQAI